MNHKFFAALVALSSSASAHLLPRNEGVARCAVPEPSAQQLGNARALQELETASLEADLEAFSAPIFIDVYVHVVSSAESKYISAQQIQDQINYMNAVFVFHSVSFALADTDFTIDSDWAAGNNELAMKSSLRNGSYSDLNLYFIDVPSLNGDKALGYCYFPESGVTQDSTAFILDGCVVMSETVPGGSMAPYNLGGTAVHEVGHWFNLFHTFQGGCNGGDMVFDTPAQASQTSGCPVIRDSCPNDPGVDPIHNFMDYSDDICYWEFTAGQTIRMHSSYETYRL